MQARARSLQYYYNHRDSLNKSKLCGCGGKYSMKNSVAHFKCKLHQKYLRKWKNIENDYSDKEVSLLESNFDAKTVFIMKFIHTTNYFDKILKQHCTGT
jgi:hypothetical protein